VQLRGTEAGYHGELERIHVGGSSYHDDEPFVASAGEPQVDDDGDCRRGVTSGSRSDWNGIRPHKR
jgi:hypothetical protein